MEQVPCSGCCTFFTPRNKAQKFCSRPACQRLRKALWQKKKLATDPEYKEGQRLAQKKWVQNNPGFWKEYRRRNPDKAARNRSLQRFRNMMQGEKPAFSQSSIAKMDARKLSIDSLSGQYWLVPEVAKMDAVKIFLTAIPGHCA
ncbi:MAG: hypothetical protein GXP56_18905 [Deltaproteobacteria bacterium]|nr:hypothetical protein [Deltaproteobacteria bacterium]